MGRDDEMHRRMEALAVALLTGTLARGLRWTETGTTEQFLYSGSEACAMVDRFAGPPQWYRLSLLTGGGSVVETWDVHPDSAVSEPAVGLLSRLYDAARREALGIDTLLDSLMNDIGSDPT
jgi:hypothetical protein